MAGVAGRASRSPVLTAGSALSTPAGVTRVGVPSRFEGVAWFLVLGVLCYVIARATWSGNPVLALHFAALLAAGCLLFAGTRADLFRAAFAANVAWVFILAAYYVQANGAPFGPGGDDLLFHEMSRQLAASWSHGDWSAASAYVGYSGFGYIVLGAVLQFVSAPLGEVGPLVIRVWGAFAGATIGPAVYILARALMPDAPSRVHVRAGAAAGLFPLLTFFAATGLRDIWLAASAAWLIALLAMARIADRGIWIGWVAPAVIVALTAVVRPESAVALVGFWLGLLYARRHTLSARLASFVLIGTSVALAVLFSEQIFEQLVRQQLSYAYAADAASAGSLGARILAIPAPAGWVARFLFAVVTPVPPLTVVRVDTILVGVGALAWYFLLPLATDGYRLLRQRDAHRKSVADAILFFALLLLVAVALTSIDVRHKIPVIPPVIALSACSLEARNARWRYDVLTTVAVIGAGLAAVYLILKSA